MKQKKNLIIKKIDIIHKKRKILNKLEENLTNLL